MAPCSTSSIHKSFKYDVFLSFRGEDTRTNFVDHLYHALNQKSIHTYKDDERIKKGKNISDELIGSIEDSKFYIIVFSKNYASSSWCLEELVKIIECQKMTDHTAYPIFYDVEPSEVRNQKGAVAQAFAKHENEEAAGKWREALKEAADLAGWELKKTADGHESKFIQMIVEELSLELRSISFNIDEKLVGMESRINDVVSSLGTGTDDVRMLGIKGIGGGGKTTLARAVFEHISFQFEGKSFIENVREVSNASLSGLKSLQNQVLLDVLNDKGVTVSSVYDGKHMMKRMMRDKKVLVVLDDVDHIDQLEALAGEPNWFKQGSRIIITTRDEQVLIAHHVKLIRGVNLLSDKEAISLFNRYAFGKKIPVQEYEELSRQVVRYADGLPLTIKVLGSFLCGKNEVEWVDALERLKTIPLTETLKKLELSYISLEEDYKEIFLDVACILKGWTKDSVIKALESCGFHARNGLKVLEQKSLITIKGAKGANYELVDMHDHIKEMGRNIVRRSHLHKPHKHSRLWIDVEVEDILANDLGTKATECIHFYCKKPNLHLVMKGFRKMKELRFLYVALFDCFRNSELDNIAILDFPNALRYLRVNNYPFRSLSKRFQGNNLVALNMAGSSIIQLWEGGERKVLNKMRFLDLSHSTLSTLDLGLTPNLETLNLKGCYDLVELHMSIGCLKLISINLTHSRLRTLDLGLAPNLETLVIAECRNLEELHMPVRCLNLRSLQLTDSRLRTLDIGLTPNLENVDLGNCCYLEELHMTDACQKLTNINISHSMLRTLDLRLAPNLKALDASYCCKLVELHMPVRCLNLRSLQLTDSRLRTLDIGLTPNLENLDLENCCYLEELHMTDEFQKLTNLNISHSMLRTLDLSLAPNLKELDANYCCKLVELHMPVRCLNLRSLQLTDSRLRTLDIGLTPNLENLDLENCCYLEELHMTDEFQKLTNLNISHSMLRTLDLSLAPNLKALDASYCCKLVELHMPVRCLNLRSLQLTDSRLRTLDIGLTPNLENLDLGNCRYLEELHMADECKKLANLNISNSKLRTLNLGLTPNLKRLDGKKCCNLVEIHTPVGCLEKIVHLDLSGCLRFEYFLFDIKDYTSCSVDKSLEVGPLTELHLTAKSLERCPLHPDNNLPKFQFSCHYYEDRPALTRNLEMIFSVGMCACTNLEMFSGSICGLQRLRKLELEGHILLELKDLHQLECLEELILSSTMIKHLPGSIWMLKHLKSLNLNLCVLLEKLPEDLGQLQCLEKLDLSYTKIKHLPDSICMLKHLKSLKLNYSLFIEKLPEDLGRLECLENLDLSYTKIKHLPDSICMLKHLNSLTITHCWFIEKLPKDLGLLECLEKLGLSNLKIKHLPDSICMLKHLKSLKLISCCFLEKLPLDLGHLEGLKELTLSSTTIKHLPDGIWMLKHLKSLNLNLCVLLEKLPEDFGRLQCLEKLDLSYTKIKHLPYSICMLKHLKSLNLRFCCFLEKLPKDLGQLECLEDLTLSSTMIRHLPDSICMLKHLKYLELDHCWFIEKLPDDLGQLKCLEKLSVKKCELLQDIPNSICEMKCLKYLILSNCIRVEKLPEELGRVECLKELEIEGTRISHLPQSILLLKDLCIIGFRELLHSP